MADVFSKATRSQVMSRIRGSENRDTELALAKLLRRNGITGWRRHRRIGVTSADSSDVRRGRYTRPDFAFARARVVVFVDGCFWHGCGKHANFPATNTKFWKAKLTANKSRDRLVNRRMKTMGWIVVRIWEHQLTSNPDACVRRIKRALPPC